MHDPNRPRPRDIPEIPTRPPRERGKPAAEAVLLIHPVSGRAIHADPDAVPGYEARGWQSVTKHANT